MVTPGKNGYYLIQYDNSTALIGKPGVAQSLPKHSLYETFQVKLNWPSICSSLCDMKLQRWIHDNCFAAGFAILWNHSIVPRWLGVGLCERQKEIEGFDLIWFGFHWLSDLAEGEKRKVYLFLFALESTTELLVGLTVCGLHLLSR